MTTPPNPNRIDQTPVRISTNVSIDRQTPKTDFGERVKIGISSATEAVANGAAVAAPFVPGGAIVSAAVSNVTAMSDQSSSGQSNGGVGAVGGQYAYAAGGVTSIPTGGDTNMSTTVGGTSLGGSAGGGYGASTSGDPSVLGTGQTTNATSYAGAMGKYVQENDKLLKLQMSMQHETQVFTTVSNVLKVRHDTVKNTIANVR